jgi:hypothetical protein
VLAARAQPGGPLAVDRPLADGIAELHGVAELHGASGKPAEQAGEAR